MKRERSQGVQLPKKGHWARESGWELDQEYTDRLVWVTPTPKRRRPSVGDQAYGPFVLREVWTRTEATADRSRPVGWWVTLPQDGAEPVHWHIWAKLPDARGQAVAVAKAIALSMEQLTRWEPAVEAAA